MMHLRNLVALGATAAVVAIGQNVRAQDDLDDLLNSLESDSPAEAPKEEAKAEAPAAEEPAAPAVEEKAEEPEAKVEEPAPAAEETAEEPAAKDDAEPAAEPEEKTEEPEAKDDAEPAAKPEEKTEEPAAKDDAEPAAEPEEKTEEPEAKDDAEPAAEPEAKAEEPAPAPAAKPAASEEDELLSNIVELEKIRRGANDTYAMREIELARGSMEAKDYREAARHYSIASRHLNDSARSAAFRRECQQGIAEALYRDALAEETLGRRERAKKIMAKAVDLRHPKARKVLEEWNVAEDPDANKTDISEISHRRNDEDYKDLRAKNLQHLRRSRQLLATRELDKALDECELVLVSDPYNQAAIRLRNTIQKKRHTILMQEREAAREGMMADVDKAWRPVYAVDAREIEDQKSVTMKTPLGDDPQMAVEQKIIKKMQDMRLPGINFKPPATIIDAIEFFRTASKDYDDPATPMEQRGFNFVIKTAETLHASAPAEEEEGAGGFGASDDSGETASAQEGVPVIPMIQTGEIKFYEALKQVCDLVGYKFKVQGQIVMIMPKDMTTDEMVTRSYPVVSAFIDRMGTASDDMKEMKNAGFGGGNSSKKDDGEANQERDWKEFFEMLGVGWPEGSSIMYIKTIGKLRVKNTYENLAELEKALTEMNADPKLIEIEARFVEVCQEDLNSLGFEWILNSDLSLNVSKHLARALNLKGGKWGSTESTTTRTITSDSKIDSLSQNQTLSTITTDSTIDNTSLSSTYTTIKGGSGSSWSRSYTANRNVGINAFGGDSGYTTGMRYLSTDSNHISGESSSTNDQLVRMNAFLGGADLSMILHMLSQRSDTDLLSAPKVLTSPGSQAVIKVVTEYIYPTDYDVQLQSSSSSSSGSSGSSQSAVLAVVEPQSFTMREVGVILDVTPTLTDDGNLINLELKTQVVDEPTWKNYGMKIPFTGNSSLQSFEGIGDILTVIPETLSALGTSLSDTVKAAFAQTTVDAATSAITSLTQSTSDNMTYYEAPMEQPFFHVRSIDSTVSVYPGATIVMGGLITEQRKAMDDKIPFLGDLPFIGRLFRSHSEQTSKRNLLIFVTSRLVDTRGREVALGDSEQKDDEVKAAPEEE